MSVCTRKTRRRLACLQALQECRQSWRKCDLRLRGIRCHSLRRGILLMDVLGVLEIVEGDVWRIVEGWWDMMPHAQSFAVGEGVCSG